MTVEKVIELMQWELKPPNGLKYKKALVLSLAIFYLKIEENEGKPVHFLCVRTLNFCFFFKFYHFKLFNLICLTSVSGESIDKIAEWQQPTYWEALEASTRRTRWGHPVDVRAAAEWSQCPELGKLTFVDHFLKRCLTKLLTNLVKEKPSGVKEIVCDGSTCMQVCEEGAISVGKRRTKCRWKRAQGFFWKRVSLPVEIYLYYWHIL